MAPGVICVLEGQGNLQEEAIGLRRSAGIAGRLGNGGQNEANASLFSGVCACRRSISASSQQARSIARTRLRRDFRPEGGNVVERRQIFSVRPIDERLVSVSIKWPEISQRRSPA